MTYNAKSDIGGTISQFSRRKSIIINSGSSLSAFQIKLTISYESSMQTDFRDIRFNDASGNYCPYWIESKTDSSTATVWIKADLVTGNNTAYIYYGNVSLTSGSDGSTTFIQYHGEATADYNDANVIPYTNIIYQTKQKFTNLTGYDFYYGMWKAPIYSTDSIYIEHTGNVLYGVVFNNTVVHYATSSVTPVLNEIQNIKIVRFGSEVHYYYNDVEKATGVATGFPDENLGLSLLVNGGAIYQYYSFARKYASSEPTVALFAD